MFEMRIDSENCTRCGFCAAVCPCLAIVQEEKELPRRHPERAGLCFACGQCMAVCRGKSITIGDLTFEKDLFELPGPVGDYAHFFNLLGSRRSVRNFKDKPVPRELLEQIVEAISQAPMGFPPHKTALTIIQNRSVIEQLIPLMVKFFDDMIGWMKNPFMRFMIRRNAGAEKFITIEKHLIPILKLRIPNMKQNGQDEIARGAPALILFHAQLEAENHTTDAHIALVYGLLAAHALGLGATAIDLIPPPINKTPRLREIIGLPEDHEVVAAMVLGYPRYKYQRGIRRNLAAVKWI